MDERLVYYYQPYGEPGISFRHWGTMFVANRVKTEKEEVVFAVGSWITRLAEQRKWGKWHNDHQKPKYFDLEMKISPWYFYPSCNLSTTRHRKKIRSKVRLYWDYVVYTCPFPVSIFDNKKMKKSKIIAKHIQHLENKIQG